MNQTTSIPAAVGLKAGLQSEKTEPPSNQYSVVNVVGLTTQMLREHISGALALVKEPGNIA